MWAGSRDTATSGAAKWGPCWSMIVSKSHGQASVRPGHVSGLPELAASCCSTSREDRIPFSNRSFRTL